jgi:hypothetical protein
MRTAQGSRLNHATARSAIAATLLAVLAACGQQRDSAAQQEMEWAKTALARNPNLEIVAADAQTRVVTVRNRRTGDLLAVKLDEIAATPVALIAAATPARTKQDEIAEPSPLEYAETDAAATSATDPEPAPDVGAEPPVAQDYRIERADGRVMVSGPGISIVSGDAAPVASAKGAPGQSTVDPIICEGDRMLHFDGRDIYVDGDAVTVRGGCELYITNSRIVASGTGVVVRGGTVHISNSYVEGAAASFDAERDARLYLRGSTFQGTSRRDALAMIEDQGGNRGLPAL